MKIVELLKISINALKMLSENEVLRDDWQYVPMYEEFHNMRRLGVKYSEAVRILAKDYGVGRATVERAVARLGREAVEYNTSPPDESVKCHRCMRFKRRKK